MSSPITAEKVRQFLRRNGFDSMPIYETRNVCHINVSTNLSISVVSINGATTAEIIDADRKDNIIGIIGPFSTMENFTSNFLTLEISR